MSNATISRLDDALEQAQQFSRRCPKSKVRLWQVGDTSFEFSNDQVIAIGFLIAVYENGKETAYFGN